MSILLPFPSGCVVGRLIRREKRFFVHVLIDGKPDVASWCGAAILRPIRAAAFGPG